MIDVVIGMLSLLVLSALVVVIFDRRSYQTRTFIRVVMAIFMFSSVLLSLICVSRFIAGFISGTLIMR